MPDEIKTLRSLTTAAPAADKSFKLQFRTTRNQARVYSTQPNPAPRHLNPHDPPGFRSQ